MPVKVGQTWQDCDTRMKGRTIRIEEIRGNYAIGRVEGTEQRTRIRLDRFKPGSRGWKLVRNEYGKRVNLPAEIMAREGHVEN